MKLSKRLSAVAAMVTDGSVVADVGTDHAFLPIYLVQQRRIERAFAMDVREGPLSRAKEHIQAYCLENQITTRLSDGLEMLQPGEADTLVLAGMGGNLMLRILEDGRETTDAFRELILQPQSEIGLVRKRMEQMGFRVLEEDMVLEDGKFYPVMKLVHGTDSYEDEVEYQYGRLLLLKKHPVLLRFLEKEKMIYRELEEKLEKSRDSDRQTRTNVRLDEIKEKNVLINRALARMSGKEQTEWGTKW